MSDSGQRPLEDHSVGDTHWSAGLIVLLVAMVALPVLSVIAFYLLSKGRVSLPGFLLIVVPICALTFWLVRWLFKRRRVTFIYSLAGSELFISKGYPGKTPLTNWYDLENLWAAQKVGETWKIETYGSGDTLIPAKLVLVFGAADGLRVHQMTLRRPFVVGQVKDEELEHQLDSWNEICASIQTRVLPRALARRWAAAPAYERYWLVLLQAEVEFLQGQCTAPQMFRATMRVITNPIKEALRMLWYGFKWVAGFYMILGAVNLFPERWPIKRIFIDDTRHFTSKFFLLLLFPFCASLGYQILLRFRPLSAQLQIEATNRASQAQRLIAAGVGRDDFDLILTFLKDEIDHVKHRLAILTVATGAPALFSLMPRFFTSVPSQASNIVAVVSIAAFALVQLYYYAHIRILHLAQTNCLIAQSELRSA